MILHVTICHVQTLRPGSHSLNQRTFCVILCEHAVRGVKFGVRQLAFKSGLCCSDSACYFALGTQCPLQFHKSTLKHRLSQGLSFSTNFLELL